MQTLRGKAHMVDDTQLVLSSPRELRIHVSAKPVVEVPEDQPA